MNTPTGIVPTEPVASLVSQVLTCEDVPALTRLAEECGMTGAALTAVAQLAVWRIKRLFTEIEEMDEQQVTDRLFELLSEEHGPSYAEHTLSLLGATARRSALAERLYGYRSFFAWVQSETENLPFSVATACQKAVDIEMWVRAGVTHDTILALLSQTPMAGRKFHQRALLEDGSVKDEYKEVVGDDVDTFLREVAALPPGQANKYVSEVLGEPQIYAAAGLYRGGRLALTIMREDKDFTEQVDLIVVKADGGEFAEVADWLMDKLNVRARP